MKFHLKSQFSSPKFFLDFKFWFLHKIKPKFDDFWFREIDLKSTFLPSIFTINFLSDLIKFEDYVKKFLNSLWIQPIFTIIPLNSSEFPKIGIFGISFDTIPREIDDLAVSSRHNCKAFAFREVVGEEIRGD